MNIYIKILLGVASLVIIVLLVALFVKKDYAVERQIVIHQPVNQVFTYVKYLKNQDNYNKWVMIDPGMKKDFKGTDGAVGFAYAWDSKDKNAGKGEQTITALEEGKQIDMRIQFIRPFAGVADSFMATEDNGNNTTTVKWGFKSKMPYPMNVALLFMDMNKMLGNDMDISLNNLKNILEKQ